ncbi:MAG TPA: hypothetical protein PLV52_03430, partial [Candidatus Omnitrophota bacterium]|nr:hypothetical protein [Candidatus Omnitrophota bacterium]
MSLESRYILTALIGHWSASFVDGDKKVSRYIVGALAAVYSASQIGWYVPFIKESLPAFPLYKAPVDQFPISILTQLMPMFIFIGIREIWKGNSIADRFRNLRRDLPDYLKRKTAQMFAKNGFYRFIVLAWSPIVFFNYDIVPTLGGALAAVVATAVLLAPYGAWFAVQRTSENEVSQTKAASLGRLLIRHPYIPTGILTLFLLSRFGFSATNLSSYMLASVEMAGLIAAYFVFFEFVMPRIVSWLGRPLGNMIDRAASTNIFRKSDFRIFRNPPPMGIMPDIMRDFRWLRQFFSPDKGTPAGGRPDLIALEEAVDIVMTGQDIEKVFNRFKKPQNLRESIDTGIRRGKLLSEKDKQGIYDEVRRLFDSIGLDERLNRIGVEKYILYIVSAMAPGRVAVKNESDLDLRLDIKVDSEDQYNKVVEAIQEASDFKTISSPGNMSCLLRAELTDRLLAMGVGRHIDLYISNLGSRDSWQSYDYNMPMGIVLSRNFSLDDERLKIVNMRLRQMPGETVSERSAALIREFDECWFAVLDKDYLKLYLAQQYVQYLPPANLDGFKKDIAPYLSDCMGVLERLRADISKHDEKFERDWRWRYTNQPMIHREIGNLRRISDSIMYARSHLSPQLVEEAVRFYESLCINYEDPLDELRIRIADNPAGSFKDLAGDPIRFIFTEEAHGVEEGFGLPQEQVIFGLLLNLIVTSDRIALDIDSMVIHALKSHGGKASYADIIGAVKGYGPSAVQSSVRKLIAERTIEAREDMMLHLLPESVSDNVPGKTGPAPAPVLSIETLQAVAAKSVDRKAFRKFPFGSEEASRVESLLTVGVAGRLTVFEYVKAVQLPFEYVKRDVMCRAYRAGQDIYEVEVLDKDTSAVLYTGSYFKAAEGATRSREILNTREHLRLYL